MKGVIDAHGALDPGRAQVQMAYLAIVGDADFGQFGGGVFLAGHSVLFKESLRGQGLCPGCALALKAP